MGQALYSSLGCPNFTAQLTFGRHGSWQWLRPSTSCCDAEAGGRRNAVADAAVDTVDAPGSRRSLPRWRSAPS